MCRSSGIGVYLRNVVPRLVDDYSADFRIVTLGGDAVSGVTERLPVRSSIYSLSEQMEIPAKLPRTADMLWSPNYNAPFLSRGKLVVTVHDACHLALPKLLHSRLKESYARTMFSNVKRRAAHVICDSKFTAGELTRLTGLSPARMTVIYPG